MEGRRPEDSDSNQDKEGHLDGQGRTMGLWKAIELLGSQSVKSLSTVGWSLWTFHPSSSWCQSLRFKPLETLPWPPTTVWPCQALFACSFSGHTTPTAREARKQWVWWFDQDFYLQPVGAQLIARIASFLWCKNDSLLGSEGIVRTLPLQAFMHFMPPSVSFVQCRLQRWKNTKPKKKQMCEWRKIPIASFPSPFSARENLIPITGQFLTGRSWIFKSM